MFNKYSIPTLALGFALIGGTTAYAFGPGGITIAALSSFSSTQQEAIVRAQEIRTQAEVEAQAILTEAGITKEVLHTAMREFHETRMNAVQEAITANDYEAFSLAVAEMPFADAVTEETFQKLVEIHELRQAGDRDAARALHAELKEADVHITFMGMGHAKRMFAPEKSE